MPDWIFAPFFTFAIVAAIVTVATIAISHGSRSLQGLRLVRRLPLGLVALLVVLGAAFFVTGPAELFRSVPGQPGYNPSTHQYYFDNHGGIIPTDRAHYLAAVATQTRAFLSFAIGATCVVILLGLTELRRRRMAVVPRLGEIPLPSTRPPWGSPPAWIGVGLGLLGLVVLGASFTRIVQRVDTYFGSVSALSTSGRTEQLSAGHWVVFTWCETRATDAPYGCSSMVPADIVVRRLASGTVIPTAIDPSVDHISPRDLPAAGQLTFSVPDAGLYRLRLTGPVPKGAFVAQSPGTIARSLALTIVVAVLGLVTAALAVLLLLRRTRWRLMFAPRVVAPAIEPL